MVRCVRDLPYQNFLGEPLVGLDGSYDVLQIEECRHLNDGLVVLSPLTMTWTNLYPAITTLHS